MSAPGSAGVPAGIRLKADEDVGAPRNGVPAGIRLKADEDVGAPRNGVPAGIRLKADEDVGASVPGMGMNLTYETKCSETVTITVAKDKAGVARHSARKKSGAKARP